MCGTETLAIVMSSTTMKLAEREHDRRRAAAVPHGSRVGVCGGRGAGHISGPCPRRRWSASIDRPTRSGCAASSLGIERDAHRQALHDLDPVAGRVLRRDQREGRAGAAGEAGDAAVERRSCRHRGRTGELDRLAGAHLVELAFLEIGVDVDGADRHDGHHRIAGGDPLADLDLAVGDDAVDRRADDRALTGRAAPGRARPWRRRHRDWCRPNVPAISA